MVLDIEEIGAAQMRVTLRIPGVEAGCVDLDPAGGARRSARVELRLATNGAESPSDGEDPQVLGGELHDRVGGVGGPVHRYGLQVRSVIRCHRRAARAVL